MAFGSNFVGAFLWRIKEDLKLLTGVVNTFKGIITMMDLETLKKKVMITEADSGSIDF